jgi:transcriptional regulator with XRE-family HTH domain
MQKDSPARTIRSARLAAKLTQAAAAAAIGVSERTWTRWEAGVTAPPPYALDAIRGSLDALRARLDASASARPPRRRTTPGAGTLDACGSTPASRRRNGTIRA